MLNKKRERENTYMYVYMYVTKNNFLCQAFDYKIMYNYKNII